MDLSMQKLKKLIKLVNWFKRKSIQELHLFKMYNISLKLTQKKVWNIEKISRSS